MKKIFDGQSADGASDTFKHFGSSTVLNIYIAGDLGGGSIEVQAQTPDEQSWVPMAGGLFTTPGVHAVFAAPFIGRLVLNGATDADLDAYVEADIDGAQTRVFEA